MFDFLKRKKKAAAAGAPKPLPSSSLKQSLLSLEQRLMFDAAAAATAAEVKSEQVAQDQAEAAVSSEASHETTGAEKGESRDVLNALASYMPTESRTEVVFVDPTVPNYQELLAGMDPNTEVIMLDAGKDGVEQIADSLAGRTGVDAIHLISHGNAGELQLGTSRLTQESMTDRYAGELAVIKGSLSEQADVLIYGCNFAEGQTGLEAVRQLADMTGADVQASTDETGHLSLGGDWEFEVHTGVIETNVAVADSVQMNWAGLLGAETVQDNFSTDSYSNNDGTQSWSSNWSETDASGGGAGGGDVRVNSSQLQIDTDTVGNAASRGVNLSGATSATLTFSYNNMLTGADRIEARVSTDGGATYGTLAGGVFSNALNTGSGSASFDISGYASANTRIQFIVTGTGGGDRLYVDNVQVSYQTNNAPTITSNGGGSTASVAVAENSTTVTTVTATDTDAGQTLSYSIAGGADAAKFTINSSTGQLSFLSAPNYESPTDSGGNNVYDVTVQVSDGNGGTDAQTVAVTLTNVGDTETLVASYEPSLASMGDQAYEVKSDQPWGQTFQYDSSSPTYSVDRVGLVLYRASDASAQTVTVSIRSSWNGPAIASGTISSSSLGTSEGWVNVNLSSSAVLADNSTYYIQVESTGTGKIYVGVNDSGTYANGALINSAGASEGSKDMGFRLLNMDIGNTTPSISSDGGGVTASTNVAENTTTVTTVTTTDPDVGQSLTYSIVGGADAAKFTINSSTGQLSFLSAPNYESPTDSGGNNVYDVTVQVSDGQGGTDTQAIAVTITNANETPTDLSLSANQVAENAANGTVVGTITGTDVDTGDTKSYSLTDTAGGRFAIDSSTGQITVADGTLLNYEAATSHSVIVRVTDSGGLTYDETFTINLTNVNEAPVITSNGGGGTATLTVAENQTAVTTVTATDVDAGTALTYSIAGGADATTFTINSSTGQLSFITAPNHEAPADSGGNNVYDVTVQVSDGSLTDSQAISVTVTNVNEAPVAADDRAGLTFDGTNDFVDMGSGVAYEVTNTVTIEAWINREPSSNVRQLIINKEGEYEVGLDANGSLMWAFANTNPGWAWHDTGVVIPVHTWTHVAVTYDHGTITSYVNGVAVETYAGSGTIGDAHPTKDSLRIGSRENNPAGQYFAGQISEVQVWNTARTAGEVAGDQNGTLTGSETGLLGYWKFNENTGTTAGNLTAHSDGTLGGGLANQDPQWATYRVNEDMTLTASGSGVLGNDYDVDGDTVSAIMVTGPSHASAFTLNPDGSFSYTPSVNFSGTDSFTYRVSDGTNLSNVATVHIQVDPVNDAPTDLALSANTVAENAANGTVVGTVTGTDPDAGETQTYSLTDTAGGRFAINSSTGVITVADGSLLNYESAASHSVTVRVTDSDGLTYDEAFTINLTNVNEAPAITSNGGGGTATLAVAENQTAVTTVTATDVDAGTALTYSIAGGADSTRFSIDAATGALRFSAAPNFERPNDAGLNNVYDVTVQVSDGQGGTATQSISVRVTDVNEAPTITSNRGGDVAAVTIRENSTTVTTVRATDPDRGARMTYSVIGGADAALFSINSRTGALRFISAPNFEQPADSDGNNLYQVVVQASDGRGGTDSQTVNVTITDRNDAPHELDFTGGFVAEGAPNGTIVGQALVSDEDRADTATYSLVDDAGGRFAIHPGTGIITVANNALIDYDLAASHTVSVRVMDAGRLARTETFTIAVTNTNETPADILLAGDTVQENAPAGTVVGTVTTQDLDVSDTHTYSLVNDAGGRFAVDQNTGEITVADGSLLDHEGNTSHSIIVRSTDSGGLMIDRTFTITVSNVNEAPTTTTVPGPLLPGTPPPPTGVPMPPATSGPVGSGPADGPALGPASTPAPSLPDAARSVSPAAAPRVMPALASMAGPGHAREGETPVVLEDDREPIAWTVVEPAMNLLHEAADQLRTLAQLPEIPVTLSELIVKELDAMTASLEDAMQGRQDEDTLVAATAAGVSVVLSAGYLVWVVRGGWLVASLMATMPAWRSFDPLPVLVRAKEDREREGLRDDRRAPRREDQQIEHLFGSEGGRAA